MPTYKSIKLTFDLDDEYQRVIYNHIKNRTNGSSYIRTLVQLDLAGSLRIIPPPQSLVFNEPPEDETESTKMMVRSEPVVRVYGEVIPQSVATTDEEEFITEGCF